MKGASVAAGTNRIFTIRPFSPVSPEFPDPPSLPGEPSFPGTPMEPGASKDPKNPGPSPPLPPFAFRHVTEISHAKRRHGATEHRRGYHFNFGSPARSVLG